MRRAVARGTRGGKEIGGATPERGGGQAHGPAYATYMPPGSFVKEAGVVPSMPPNALVKVEVEVVVKEEQRSDRRPKRQRTK